MRIHSLLIASLLIVLISFVGQAEPQVVRVGCFPTITHSRALIGKANGAFTQALGSGIRIEWKTFNAGPSAIEALFAGAVARRSASLPAPPAAERLWWYAPIPVSRRAKIFMANASPRRNIEVYGQSSALPSSSATAAAVAGSTASAISSASPTDKNSTAAVRFGANGLVFSNEDGSDQLKVHGFVQGDGRFFSSDLKDSSPDRLLWRRIRPIFEGTVFQVLDFRFMPDFGQNNSLIQDVYAELNVFSFAKPRLGKYKTPLSLEMLKSDNEFTLVERSLASDLVPNREVGAQVGASLFKKSINYAVGYFNGTTDGSSGQTFAWRTSNEAAGRIFLQPFLTTKLEPLKGLGFGIGGSAANEHGALPSFKTVGQNSFFKYSSKVVAAGQHNRLSPQAYYYAGPVGIFSEYNISSQEVISNKTSARLQNQAWQFTGSVMLTGEKNCYSGIRPRYGFEPNRGIRHLGGWELVGRYSRLRVDPAAFPLFADPKKSAEGAREWGVGLNWYLNRFARIGTDYEHTQFDMASHTVAPLHSENVIMSRIQLAF